MALRQNTNINLYRGDTNTYTFYLTDSLGNVINYTGATVRFQIKASIDGSTLVTVNPSNGSDGNDWANGKIVIKVTAAQSATVSANAVYDLQVTDASSNVITPVFGTVIVQKDVSS